MGAGIRRNRSIGNLEGFKPCFAEDVFLFFLMGLTKSFFFF